MMGDNYLKEIFVIYFQRISDYIDELKRIEKDLSGSINSSKHTLKDFSFKISESDGILLLRKCEELGERSIDQYESILKEDIPVNIKDIVFETI
jgi:hypothetical protein